MDLEINKALPYLGQKRRMPFITLIQKLQNKRSDLRKALFLLQVPLKNHRNGIHNQSRAFQKVRNHPNQVFNQLTPILT